MSVFALGLNHQTATLDLRGRFAFNLEHLAATLQTLQQRLCQDNIWPQGRPEAALLSTCNRTELYWSAPWRKEHATEPPALNRVLEWLAEVGHIGPEVLKPYVYVRSGEEVARHAFRVASGLDSMVLGEPQILGQMKQAAREAAQAGLLGTTLHQLFQRSFAVAKEVRTATEIGAHSISMAAAAVRLAEQLFEDLRDIRILLIGAGEMIDLVATHFAARQPKQIMVANRTLDRAERLAARFNAQAMRLVELPARLHEFDAVISCTASSVPIIGLGAIERALKARRHRPIFMVDLAVPRDIEREAAELDDIYLYTVDDLASLVQTAGEKRQAAVAQAEVIIEHGVQSFVHWLDQRASVPLIQALQDQASSWREQELIRARKLLGRGEDIEQVLDALAKGLTQKMLHGAFAELHQTDAHERAHLSEFLTRLFLRGETRAQKGFKTVSSAPELDANDPPV